MNAARSVHLSFSSPSLAECYLRGRVDRFARGSYFAAIAFDGGYFGIQEWNDGRHVTIFSLWHDGRPGCRTPDEVIWAHRIGQDGFVRDFGGEGEGLQSFVPFPWRLQEDLEFRITTESFEGRTVVSACVLFEGRWRLVSSLSRVGESRLIEKWYAFIEDFRRDGRSQSEQRQVTILDCWGRPAGSEWSPIESARSSADPSPITNFDARQEGQSWIMETGGLFSNSVPLGSNLFREVRREVGIPHSLTLPN